MPTVGPARATASKAAIFGAVSRVGRGAGALGKAALGGPVSSSIGEGVGLRRGG